VNELSKDDFMKAAAEIWPSEQDKMKVYFAEATKGGDGLSASRKQFIQFKNYLDAVGDTKCTLRFTAYNSLSPVEAFKANKVCHSHED